MTDEQHLEMLNTILGCKGKVMLSGYLSEMYEEKLKGWNRYDFLIDNKSAKGDKKRIMTECVWINYEISL
jgi:DNA adenine methylase